MKLSNSVRIGSRAPDDAQAPEPTKKLSRREVMALVGQGRLSSWQAAHLLRQGRKVERDAS